MNIQSMAQAARDYCERGFALVPIPPRSKGPKGDGWNTAEKCLRQPEEAERYYRRNPLENAGVLHSASATCSLDIDAPEHALAVLAHFGIDAEQLRDTFPTVQGKPGRWRTLFRVPDGAELSAHKLNWPDPNKPGKRITVFELRAGAVQDVLPPSIHPDTQAPYSWLTPLPEAGELPVLPAELLAIWRNWPKFEKDAQELCPWRPQETRIDAPKAEARPEGAASVIGPYNAAHSVPELLERHGYQKRGKKYLAPNSSSGYPGITILDGGRCFSHHGSDVLGDGHAHDAFDVFAMLEHGGDVSKATKAAALELGIGRDATGDGQEGATGGAGGAPRGEQGQGGESRAKGDSLPEPLPLPKPPPVPDFPLDLLPDGLRAWVGDAAERARFRPDFAAVAGMVALGSVIGRKLGIRLKRRDDWTEYANVWGAMIGPPSALKSPAARDAMRPLRALQAAADERHREAMAEYEAQVEAYKIRREAAKKSATKALAGNPGMAIDLGDAEPPEKPVARTYWTSDVNEASLGERLAENPTGLLIERDELSSLLVNLEDERNATLRGMLLSGWSGNESYRFDRIMRGVTILPKFALSVFGGIQPGPLSRYVRGAFGGERADGLLQRIQLAVWPEPEAFEYVDRWPDSDARKAAADLFKRADSFDAEAIGRRDNYGNDPPFVRLSEDAQGLFVEWYSIFMRERRTVEAAGGESAPLAAHFGKYPGLVGKLALNIHVADDPDATEVSERTLLKALAWIEYLTPHAKRIYHAVEHPETGAAELLLARLRRDELPKSFKAWEITRKGWHGLADSEGVKKACRLLFEYGWLIELEPGGGNPIGRPADPVYAVSPPARVAR